MRAPNATSRYRPVRHDHVVAASRDQDRRQRRRSPKRIVMRQYRALRALLEEQFQTWEAV